ncbi:MAG: D-alanyl-D-alanine carboxypeptidase [bacterium]|nr:D-alanyl-D-alanine carboxypeptidase [bacterium]
MKRIFFLIIFFLLCISSNIYADNLSGYIVSDMKSGRIFYEKSANKRILPASTTKVMTAIVAIENSNLTDVVHVGDEILTVDGTNIYLEPGESILMSDLLYGLIMRSGNDCAMAIGKHISGSVSNFVKLMNEKARELGLKNTVFNNPTGLDDYEENYTSLSDLAKIYTYAYNNTVFREIINTLEYKTSSDKKSYYFKNRTKILSMYDKITGGKTGYTPKAGRLLISSASNNDMDLVITSVGNGYGYNEHINFYEKVFSNYKNYLIIDKNNFNVSSSLGKTYIKKSFSYPLSTEEFGKISKKVVFNNNKKGIIGQIQIYLKDDLIYKDNVYLKKEKTSFFKRIFGFIFS